MESTGFECLKTMYRAVRIAENGMTDMSEEVNRAEYDRDNRQIVINLDHPQFVAALGAGSIQDPIFSSSGLRGGILRICYRVSKRTR